MKTFTLSEAHRMLPLLDDLLTRAQQAAAAARTQMAELKALQHQIHERGGMTVDLEAVLRKRVEQEKSAAIASESVAEITGFGVEVRDLDEGVLEFPFLLEGDVVMLCWNQGRTSITEWRNPEEEDAEPRPLDRRFTWGERSH